MKIHQNEVQIWTIFNRSTVGAKNSSVFTNYEFVHGTIKTIVAKYLEIPWEHVNFDCNYHGKPFIPAHLNPKGLEISISHTKGLSILGVTANAVLGVDIERIDRSRNHAAIVQQYFSKQEHDHYSALSPQDREKYFYTLWTLKEAFIKAQGDGLSLGLERINIHMTPEDHISVELDGKPLDYTLRILEVGKDYAAALATPQEIKRIEVFDYLQ